MTEQLHTLTFKLAKDLFLPFGLVADIWLQPRAQISLHRLMVVVVVVGMGDNTEHIGWDRECSEIL